LIEGYIRSRVMSIKGTIGLGGLGGKGCTTDVGVTTGYYV
jgi:hypothetical protein